MIQTKCRLNFHKVEYFHKAECLEGGFILKFMSQKEPENKLFKFYKKSIHWILQWSSLERSCAGVFQQGAENEFFKLLLSTNLCNEFFCFLLWS